MFGSLSLKGNHIAVSTFAVVVGLMLFTGSVCFAEGPRFLNCPDSVMAFNHCKVFAYDFDVNQESYTNPSAVIYSIAETNVRGEIDLDRFSGLLVYYPHRVDVGLEKEITVRACQVSSNKCNTCTVYLNILNTPPTCVILEDQKIITVGDTLVFKPAMVRDDDLCDIITYRLVRGPGEIDTYRGYYTWAPGENDAGEHEIVIVYSDGYLTDHFSFTVRVLNPKSYEIEIVPTEFQIPGQWTDVDIMLYAGSEDIGGYDFVIGYDAERINFTEAAPGDLPTECDWEYFTYRYNWYGNCGENCPSGLIRLVALAETNNGPYHPDCFGVDQSEMPITLATMTFYVGNFQGTVPTITSPIRFYWMDCGDNSIASVTGDTLWVSQHVIDYDGTYFPDPIDFPTYAGAPNTCLIGDKYTPVRYINFINGAFNILTDNDLLGDINVNGIPYEIADWVIFRNYFLNGIDVFNSHIPQSMEASDADCDGIQLRLEDFVRLARVITGDAEPCQYGPIIDTLTAILVDFTWNPEQKVVYVGSPYNKIAAVYMVFLGEIVPTLDLEMDNLILEYTHDSGMTRVLVYSEPENTMPEFNLCRLISYEGEGQLQEIYGADLHDHFVVTDMYSDTDDEMVAMPSEIELFQNYPNPFNPATSIRFSVPRGSDVTLDILNILGQRVVTLVDDHLAAGNHSVTWNGCDAEGVQVASGVYLYRLTAGEYVSSKRMILSK